MLGPSIWRAVLCVSVFDVAGTGVVGHRAHGWNVNKFLSGRMASRSFLVRRTCVVGMKGWGLDGLGLAHYWVLNQRAHRSCSFGVWVVVLGSRFALSAIRAAGLLGWWLWVLVGVVVWELHSGREHLAGHHVNDVLRKQFFEYIRIIGFWLVVLIFSIKLLSSCRSFICTCDTFGVACVVCKFLRAHGGCLGIGSRRRTWESAISLDESITGH